MNGATQTLPVVTDSGVPVMKKNSQVPVYGTTVCCDAYETVPATGIDWFASLVMAGMSIVFWLVAIAGYLGGLMSF